MGYYDHYYDGLIDRLPPAEDFGRYTVPSPDARPTLGRKCVIAVFGDSDEELLWTAEIRLIDAEATLHQDPVQTEISVRGYASNKQDAVLFYPGYADFLKRTQ
jgi:hypothetical protein